VTAAEDAGRRDVVCAKADPSRIGTELGHNLNVLFEKVGDC